MTMRRKRKGTRKRKTNKWVVYVPRTGTSGDAGWIANHGYPTHDRSRAFVFHSPSEAYAAAKDYGMGAKVRAY